MVNHSCDSINDSGCRLSRVSPDSNFHSKKLSLYPPLFGQVRFVATSVVGALESRGATRLGMVLRLETPAFDNRSIFSYFSLSDTIKRPKESQILEIEKRSQPQTITKKTKIQIRKLWICEMNLRIFLIIILELIGAIKTSEKTFREKRNFSRVKSKEVRFQQILMVPQQMLHFYLMITFKLLALYW